MSKSAKVTIRLNSTVMAMMLRIIGRVTKNSFCTALGAVDGGGLVQLLGHRFQRRQIHDHEERRAVPDIHRDHAEPRDPAGTPSQGTLGEAERVQHPVERGIGRVEHPPPGQRGQRQRDHPGHQQQAAPDALLAAGDVVHQVRQHEADQRLQHHGA